MLALRNSNPERVFVPIIPLRSGNQNSFEKANNMTKMVSKNPDLLKLMAAFELK